MAQSVNFQVTTLKKRLIFKN